MRACTHNVLLVNQITCSRGEESKASRTIRVYYFTFISNVLMRCAIVCMYTYACMYVCMDPLKKNRE